MATSGITTNQLTRNQVIEAAIRKTGALALDQTLTATEYSNALINLNALLGAYRSLGLNLWTRTSTTFALTTNVSTYNIGTGQTINTPYPIHIVQAYRTDSSTNRVDMEVVADFNFNLYPPESSGGPIQLTYQPRVNTGIIKLWPKPDSSAATNSTVTIVYTRPMEYMSASSDTFDMPEEWYLALIYNLAMLEAPEYGVPINDQQRLEKLADKYLNLAIENGTEDASLFLQADYRSQ